MPRQVCATTQLLLDPYFRTIDGFATLIEKGVPIPSSYHPHSQFTRSLKAVLCARVK
jgi:hypothetical protein